MIEAVQRWVNQSQYDLVTARAMLTSGRYLYILFCCQQAVEKALKAVIVSQTGGLPPRIHNLLRLSEIAGIELPPDRNEFLGELCAYYIQSRYPEEISAMGSKITHGIAAATLRRTEETSQWVSSMLK